MIVSATEPAGLPDHVGVGQVVIRVLTGLAVVVAILGGAAVAQAATRHGDLDRVRAATVAFRDVSVAEHAGYAKFVDVNGVACIDMPGMGAMGVHYVSGLVNDTVLEPTAPEALVYQPDGAGRMKLVAVEYIVFEGAWTAAGHTDPPSLFGQTFSLTPSPNRFGLPAFYSLHAWVWKHNRAGAFSMWNPAVHCPKWTP